MRQGKLNGKAELMPRLDYISLRHRETTSELAREGDINIRATLTND